MDKTNKYTLSKIKNVSMKEAAFKYAELVTLFTGVWIEI
jgi:hypothetical protein